MKMKVLRYPKPYQAEIVEADLPAIGKHQALAKTIVSNVSAGTEMAFYRGTAPQLNSRIRPDGLWEDAPDNITYPMQSDGAGVWWMGYAAVSEVVEVGSDVNDLKIGDIVFTYGPHKEYQIIEGGYFKVPAKLKPEQASFTALTDIVFNGILDSAIKLMDNVVIIGMGTLGQLALQMSKLSGAFVIAADFIDRRLQLASKLGADETINPKAEGDLAKSVIKILGERADLVIEVTGNSKALADAVRCVRNDGQVTVLSFYQSPPDNFQPGREFHHNRIIIRSSHTGEVNPALRNQYDNKAKRTYKAMQLISRLDVDSLISHRCKFDDYPKMLETIDKNPSECQSVIIEY